MAKNEVLVANYHCRFGAEKRLLDCALEVVIPAYTSNELFRKYGDTSYFFHETVVVNLGDKLDPILAICGRFIKDTSLKREQVFSKGVGLIKDRRAMQSSPSAIFLLILNNHRLVYYPETAHAPDLKSFEATSLNLLRKTHKQFIDAEYSEKKSWGEKTTKKNLTISTPPPTLDVVPLSSKESLSEFIRRYDKLQKIAIKLVNPNDEIDVDDFFKGIREQKERLGSKDTSLTHTNQTEGLDKEQSIKDLSSITSIGLHKMSFTGKDQYGDKLTGNNHDFHIRTPVAELDGDIPTKAEKLHDVFETMIAQKIVDVPPQTETIYAKVVSVFRRLMQDD